MQQRSVQIEQLLSVLCPDGITASFGWNLLFASRAGKRQHIDFIVARLVVDMRHPVATFRYNSATVEFSSNYPYRGRMRTFRNFTTPALRWSAKGPSVCASSMTSTVRVPFNVTTSREPSAVIS